MLESGNSFDFNSKKNLFEGFIRQKSQRELEKKKLEEERNRRKVRPLQQAAPETRQNVPPPVVVPVKAVSQSVQLPVGPPVFNLPDFLALGQSFPAWQEKHMTGFKEALTGLGALPAGDIAVVLEKFTAVIEGQVDTVSPSPEMITALSGMREEVQAFVQMSPGLLPFAQEALKEFAEGLDHVALQVQQRLEYRPDSEVLLQEKEPGSSGEVIREEKKTVGKDILLLPEEKADKQRLTRTKRKKKIHRTEKDEAALKKKEKAGKMALPRILLAPSFKEEFETFAKTLTGMKGFSKKSNEKVSDAVHQWVQYGRWFAENPVDKHNRKEAVKILRAMETHALTFMKKLSKQQVKGLQTTMFRLFQAVMPKDHRLSRQVYGLPVSVIKMGDTFYHLPKKSYLGRGSYGVVALTYYFTPKTHDDMTRFLRTKEIKGEAAVIKKIRQSRQDAKETEKEYTYLKLLADKGGLGVFGMTAQTGAKGAEKFYIVMEKANSTFEKLISFNALKLSDPKVLDTVRYIFVQLLTRVSGMHAEHVVHMDIKPENILVTQSGELVLSDTGGVAKEGEKSDFMTRYYGAPEIHGERDRLETRNFLSKMETKSAAQENQLKREDVLHEFFQVSTASDVFSLGVVFWEYLLGRHQYPWKTIPIIANALQYGDISAEMRRYYLLDDVKMPSRFPPELKDFLRCMLDDKPGRRWTADALLRHPFLKPFYAQFDTIILQKEEWTAAEVLMHPVLKYCLSDTLRQQLLSMGPDEKVAAQSLLEIQHAFSEEAFDTMTKETDFLSAARKMGQAQPLRLAALLLKESADEVFKTGTAPAMAFEELVLTSNRLPAFEKVLTGAVDRGRLKSLITSDLFHLDLHPEAVLRKLPQKKLLKGQEKPPEIPLENVSGSRRPDDALALLKEADSSAYKDLLRRQSDAVKLIFSFWEQLFSAAETLPDELKLAAYHLSQTNGDPRVVFDFLTGRVLPDLARRLYDLPEFMALSKLVIPAAHAALHNKPFSEDHPLNFFNDHLKALHSLLQKLIQTLVMQGGDFKGAKPL